jgi:hypothetical protein
MPARGSSTLRGTVDCISVRVACTELLLPPSGGTSRGRQTIKGHGAICFSLLAARGKHRPSVNRKARSRGRRPAGGALGAGLLVAGAVCSFSSGGSRPSWAPSGPWMLPRMVRNPLRPLSCLSGPDGIKARDPDMLDAPQRQGSTLMRAGLARLLLRRGEACLPLYLEPLLGPGPTFEPFRSVARKSSPCGSLLPPAMAV